MGYPATIPTGGVRHRYIAYGLRLASDLDLPALAPWDDAALADATVTRRQIDPPSVAAQRFGDLRLWHSPGGTRIEFSDTGALFVRDGREIHYDPPVGYSPEGLRLAITGPALGLLLHQRGLLVLHGSAVAIDGVAVALLGNSGAGKSTLAAALVGRGHALIADDIVAVDLSGAAPEVPGGYPQQKLWPDAARTLALEPALLDRLDPAYEKRSVTVGNFDAGPRRLGAIYVLEPPGAVAVERVGSGDAYIELIRQSYVSALIPLGGADRHMQQSHQLLQHVELRRLHRPDEGGPEELVRILESDLRHGPPDPGEGE